jgi:hypothetical protein
VSVTSRPSETRRLVGSASGCAERLAPPYKGVHVIRNMCPHHRRRYGVGVPSRRAALAAGVVATGERIVGGAA